MPAINFDGKPASFPFNTAAGNNATNSQNAAPSSVKGRTSIFVTNTVPAGETLPVPCTGNQFYITAATGKIAVRPLGGAFNEYTPGTGLQLDLANTFAMLEVKNLSSQPVVFQIFAGFDGFIDKRLYLLNENQPQVVRPTYSVPSSAASVDIDDISGQAFSDINGGQWYALQRVSMMISNTDTGTTLLLQEASSTVANGPAIAAIFPETSFIYNASGNYRLHLGGANINAIVSEIYSALPKLTP